MITYGGRVLNTSRTPVYKGGSAQDLRQPPQAQTPQIQTSQPQIQAQTSQTSQPSQINQIHGGGMITSDEFNEKIIEFFKESPKELWKAMRNASVTGTIIGSFLGAFAWPISWAWWIITSFFAAIYYFIVLCFVIFLVKVIQGGLDIVHGAINGVLAPLKAVYNIKIAGSRLFGFLGGPVRSLNQTKEGIAKTVLELLLKTMKKMLE